MDNWKTALLVALLIGFAIGLSRCLMMKDIGDSMDQQRELREALKNRPKD